MLSSVSVYGTCDGCHKHKWLTLSFVVKHAYGHSAPFWMDHLMCSECGFAFEEALKRMRIPFMCHDFLAGLSIESLEGLTPAEWQD